jgi:GT2 family glycosyltransferase
VLILNPDLRLAAGSVRGLVAALAPGVGAVVPRFEDSSGVRYPSLRREPSVLRAFGDAVLGKRWPARPGWLSEMVWPVPAYEKEGPVEWSTGAAILIRLEADAQVGPWDAERFFLYSEETDYLRRVRAAGWAVRYVPSAVVVHRGGGSGSGPELVALGLVNRLRYFRKYHGRPATAAFGAAVLLGELLRARRPASRRALSILVRPSRWADLPGGRRVPAGDRVARPADQGADQAEDARVSGIARSLPGGHRR